MLISRAYNLIGRSYSLRGSIADAASWSGVPKTDPKWTPDPLAGAGFAEGPMRQGRRGFDR